jgi:hypothetical protein
LTVANVSFSGSVFAPSSNIYPMYRTSFWNSWHFFHIKLEIGSSEPLEHLLQDVMLFLAHLADDDIIQVFQAGFMSEVP